jgi:hypothetical protein
VSVALALALSVLSLRALQRFYVGHGGPLDRPSVAGWEDDWRATRRAAISEADPVLRRILRNQPGGAQFP